jgi:hypothetical protein
MDMLFLLLTAGFFAGSALFLLTKALGGEARK